MIENLTQEAFARNVKTKFRVVHDGERQYELELDAVEGYRGEPGGPRDLERFSLYFYGPADARIEQQTCRLAHEELGEMYVFLVPVGLDERGHRYEAVFNQSA